MRDGGIGLVCSNRHPSRRDDRAQGRVSAVPPGLVGLCAAKPNVETLGYYHASLRDKQEILAVLDGSRRAVARAQRVVPASW